MKQYALRKALVDDWKRLRGETDMHLAAVTGVHPMTFNKYLRGFPVPLGVVLDLVQHTGIPLERMIVEIPQDARRAG